MTEYKKGRSAPHIQRKASRDYLERNREHINELRRMRYAQMTTEERRTVNGRRVYGQRQRAGNRLRYAVATGKIIRPDKCSQCGKVGKIEGHHENYDKPLEVIWLCKDCHGLTRRKRDFLIAAAPELLEALKDVLESLVSVVQSEFQTSRDHHPEDSYTCVKQARAVIARAEGGV